MVQMRDFLLFYCTIFRPFDVRLRLVNADILHHSAGQRRVAEGARETGGSLDSLIIIRFYFSLILIGQ